MTLKTRLHDHLFNALESRKSTLQLGRSQLSIDSTESGKGSAGDKHETDLAMVHLEQEQLSKKLSQLLENLQTWQQIDFASSASTVKQGSLVKTNLGWLLISIALPQYKIENETVISISPQSPLGQLLIGKQPNERFELNQKTFEVQEIL
jgi:transcription elongation GreA/GreB family factor